MCSRLESKQKGSGGTQNRVLSDSELRVIKGNVTEPDSVIVYFKYTDLKLIFFSPEIWTYAFLNCIQNIRKYFIIYMSYASNKQL